jgi:hypothetical protein
MKRIEEDKGAIKWTRLSCHSASDNVVRLQLHAVAYNLETVLRTFATPGGQRWKRQFPIESQLYMETPG